MSPETCNYLWKWSTLYRFARKMITSRRYRRSHSTPYSPPYNNDRGCDFRIAESMSLARRYHKLCRRNGKSSKWYTISTRSLGASSEEQLKNRSGYGDIWKIKCSYGQTLGENDIKRGHNCRNKQARA